MLNNHCVSSVDNIFSLWNVAFVLDRNLEKLRVSTRFLFSFGSSYYFHD
jgi:hypothetical protein